MTYSKDGNEDEVRCFSCNEVMASMRLREMPDDEHGFVRAEWQLICQCGLRGRSFIVYEIPRHPAPAGHA